RRALPARIAHASGLRLNKVFGSGPGRRHLRRGLAPLEFVLWLPVLLFVMALMMNYGTVATWRVRSEIISRDAVWRTRWPRDGANESPPTRPYWPDDAVMTTQPDAAPVILDIPDIDHPVVRGPLPNGFVVRPILDPTQGAVKGVSEVNRQYPLLPRMGSFESGDVDTPLIDRKWSSAEMGFWNTYRRTLALYEFPRTDSSLPQAFSQAIQSVLSIPHFADLAVLDRDADILRYTGGYVDFHPRVGRMCELDPQVVYDRQVERLVDIREADGDIRLGAISLLPRTMTNYFLGMYRAAVQRMTDRIQELQDELNGTPPPTPQRQAEILAEIAALQAEIAIILPKIAQLEEYEARLPQIEDDLRANAGAVLP
ncbi:MAG: hypothetical protein O3C40_13795, partial [Planctomycetota bacterium]|nr:hypothetical protein [Planctomycetota bacterium]